MKKILWSKGISWLSVVSDTSKPNTHRLNVPDYNRVGTLFDGKYIDATNCYMLPIEWSYLTMQYEPHDRSTFPCCLVNYSSCFSSKSQPESSLESGCLNNITFMYSRRSHIPRSAICWRPTVWEGHPFMSCDPNSVEALLNEEESILVLKGSQNLHWKRWGQIGFHYIASWLFCSRRFLKTFLQSTLLVLNEIEDERRLFRESHKCQNTRLLLSHSFKKILTWKAFVACEMIWVDWEILSMRPQNAA